VACNLSCLKGGDGCRGGTEVQDQPGQNVSKTSFNR
jgi:hypothetical protein